MSSAIQRRRSAAALPIGVLAQSAGASVRCNRDLLEGNAGNDRIRSRDEYPATVRCGAGRDQVTIGRGDALSGCEQIDRTPQRR
ncbi:MAG: hypothetical protein H0X42_01910 [Solirubrobacterales bacterium]|nr:hypothetical protein [Solirubrobacterales bacterium]